MLDRAAEIRTDGVRVTRSVFASLLRPESTLLYDRITEAWAGRMRPILTLMIEQGVEQGAFDTSDPEGVANVILHMGESTRYLLDRGMAAGESAERNPRPPSCTGALSSRGCPGTNSGSAGRKLFDRPKGFCGEVQERSQPSHGDQSRQFGPAGP